MAYHQVNFSLSTAQIVLLSLTLGITLGIPIGITAFQFGWSLGASGDRAAQRFEHPPLAADYPPLVNGAACINGIAYAPNTTNKHPAWQGVLRPVEQAEPTEPREDGLQVAVPSIPVRCAVSRF